MPKLSKADRSRVEHLEEKRRVLGSTGFLSYLRGYAKAGDNSAKLRGEMLRLKREAAR